MVGLLQDRCGLIVGAANARSIAYGIAQAAATHGARLVLTYQNERFMRSVKALGEALSAHAVLPCDLADEAQLGEVMRVLEHDWGRLDFVVHAAAAARPDELGGRFIDTSYSGFTLAMQASVYSLVALARAAEPLLQRGRYPAVLTLSYLGAQRAMPNYNVMGVAKAALESTVRYLAQDMGPGGVRVNALSPGPIRTVSAAGVRGLRDMLGHAAATSPLRRNVTIDDVGAAALFVISDLGRATTGEVIYVDAGYHAVGAPPPALLDKAQPAP